MFDVPPPSNKSSLNTVEMPLMIDSTTSLENSSIRTQDNFVFTSFVEPIRVKPQSSYNNQIKNKKSSTTTSTSISSNKRFYDDFTTSYGEIIENNINHVIIDESYHQIQQTIEKTPRPPNAFILYRRAKQPLITKERGNISNAKISKLLAKMWRNESEEEKLHWQKIADRKKMEHMEAHPGYVYRPKKPISNDKRKRRKSSPSKQQISTLENTCVPELVTSNVNSSAIDSVSLPLVFYDNSSSYNHSFPYIFPQESMVPYFFLEQPKEMNFNSDGGFNFFEQSSQYSPYFFIDSPYNTCQDISQEQLMITNGFIPFNCDPMFNFS
ncbi:mating-type HMG-box protein MAT1-2 [Rhizophagus clarus]|nr:mating-type HMG-box protein MAT1-2 [Rhizophagus clarus]